MWISVSNSTIKFYNIKGDLIFKYKTNKLFINK